MSSALKSRLKRVSAAEAALLTHLADPVAEIRLALTSHLAPGWVVLEAERGGWEAWLAPIGGPQGPLPLRSDDGLPDAARMAVALEAIEPLTARLERSWATALRPVRIERHAPDPIFQLDGLGSSALLRIQAPDSGRVSLPDRQASPDRLASVQLPAEWRVFGPQLASDRVARLGRGDMLLLPAICGGELGVAEARWSGCVDWERRTITLTQSGGDEMSTADNGWAGARTPLQLVIDAGSVSVGQLATLGPGGILTLEGRRDVLEVEVRAGGARIGRGELVAVGDAFGVVLTEISLPPSPPADTAERVAESAEA